MHAGEGGAAGGGRRGQEACGSGLGERQRGGGGSGGTHQSSAPSSNRHPTTLSSSQEQHAHARRMLTLMRMPFRGWEGLMGTESRAVTTMLCPSICRAKHVTVVLEGGCADQGGPHGQTHLMTQQTPPTLRVRPEQQKLRALHQPPPHPTPPHPTTHHEGEHRKTRGVDDPHHGAPLLAAAARRREHGVCAAAARAVALADLVDQGGDGDRRPPGGWGHVDRGEVLGQLVVPVGGAWGRGGEG